MLSSYRILAQFGMIKLFLANDPWPKEADIQRLCMMFKAQTNGTDIWPKVPTMIKPAMKRWKVNQLIAVLKLKSGQS